MSAFDDGRVGLWINDPSNLNARLDNISKFAGGMFTDLFLPSRSSRAQFDLVRAKTRPDGSKLKAQLYEVPLPAEPAADFAERVHTDITRLSPGVVELDIEVGDTGLSRYLRDTVNELRARRPGYFFRLNVEPNKGGFLPIDLIQNDPLLYACEQTYYGDMSPVSQSEVLSDLEGHGVPASKDQVTYGAAITTKVPNGDGTFTWKRVLGLPTIAYKGQIVAKLKSGLVFDDDLMAEVGVL